MKKFYIILFLVSFYGRFSAQENLQSNWVDSVLQTMSLESKIGQLFIIRSYAKPSETQSKEVQSLIQNYHVGGVCFFKGTIPVLTEMINQYQSWSGIPLMMSMDAEWGIGMRMTDGFSFPKNMTLGAIRDNRLIYFMAREMATQLKDAGIHMNFAPVLDINNNLLNPVINERSFSSSRKNVIAKSFAYMRGLEDGGILSCLKHFPGHGDTEVDSHADLPILSHSRKHLDSLELYPFRTLLHYQPAAVMVAHLNIPSLDSAANIPSTLSPAIVETILRKQYHYNGLIITDALEMKGVTKYFSAGDIALKALQAGNDILLLSEDIPAAIDRLKTAILTGELIEPELNKKVRRILNAKYQLGLNAFKPVTLDSAWFKRSWIKTNTLNEILYRKSVTLVRDYEKMVPIRTIPKEIVCISVNSDTGNTFQKRIKDFTNAKYYSITAAEHWNPELKDAVNSADLVIISIHKLNYQQSKQYGISTEIIAVLNEITDLKKSVFCVFGCPYVSMYLPDKSSLLLSYEEKEMTQDLMAQLLFGTDQIEGQAPVDVGNVLVQGEGYLRPTLMRLGYCSPEMQNINSDTLKLIDSLVYDLISQKAAPGCQVLIAKNNHIVFNKSYGFFNYDSIISVDDHTLYDLASLTKIICTAPVLMSLDDQNKIDLTKRFSDYLPEFEDSNKKELTLHDFLTHQGRLLAWIPFYKSTLLSPDTLNILDTSYYSKVATLQFNIPVCDSMYLRSDFRDSIYIKILNSKLLDEKRYLYSDLGFYFIPKLISKLKGIGLEPYFIKNFVKPLSLRFTAFNPLSKHFDKNKIPPTENDQYFRHKTIQGYVHDMGAAMMGGISGHAGLFANAHDVAVMMQLVLNSGTYGGQEYIGSETVIKFTTRDKEFNRRALLFDLPELDEALSNGYVSSLASKKTYGHQGFTGTCVWVDPENKLLFVFLSNRTYPDGKINLLHKNRYRTKIQDIIYKSLFSQNVLN